MKAADERNMELAAENGEERNVFQTEQPEEVGYGGAFLAYALAQRFLSQTVLLDKLAECQGDFYGVEVLALDILDEGHLCQLGIVGGAYICRHRLEACHEGGAVTALSGDYLI